MESSTNNDNYNRPNLDWVCTAEAGCGCPNGPTPKGGCQKNSQCQSVLIDSSWKCNRPDNRGGVCETGPDPNGNCCLESQGCVPKRSLRNKRKIFVICCVSWITGILLLGIWGPNRNEFFAPGDLSSNHSQIWSSGNGENRCIACHAAGETDPFAWFMDAFSGGTHIGQPQYEKCLNCHQNSIGPEHALQVHNLSQDKLNLLTASAQIGGGKTLLASANIFATPVNHNGELACAHCHQEHHGRSHDLAAMTNQQCQNCHSNQFHSFAEGHPEFKSYSNTERTRIAFDHYSHQGKYFADAKRSFDCNSCHVADDNGNVFKIKPFETSCADCHAQKIDATLTQGMPIFQIPSIDIGLLREKGLEVGTWPESASTSFDGGLPPVMKILLASDIRAKKAMEVLGPEFDLFDVEEESETHLIAVYNLAISIKSLMYDLSQSGQAGLVDRLKAINQNDVSKSQLQKMVANLSSDTFSQAQEKWFPDLAAEKDRLKRPTPPTHPTGSANTSGYSLVVPASFVHNIGDSKNDELLAENPLKNLVASATAEQQKSTSLQFVDLPDEATQRDPGRSTIDFKDDNVDQKRVRENKFVARDQQTDEQQYEPTEFKPNVPNAVGNKFFRPNTGAPEPDRTALDRSKQLAINPLANLVQQTTKEIKRDGARQVTNPYSEKSSSPITQQDVGKTDSIPKLIAKQPTTDSPKTDSQQQNDGPIIIRNENMPTPANSEVWLAENPLTKLLQKSEGPKKDPNELLTKNKVEPTDNQKNDANQQNIVQINNGQQNNSFKPKDPAQEQDPPKSPTQVAEKKNPRKSFDMNRLPPEKRVPLGGWYRDDISLTVAYRQSGHADSLTVHWYEFVAQLKNAQNDSAFADLARQMNKTTSPGLCTSCHSVDQFDESQTINWVAEYRDVTKRGFTRFSHRPHMIQSNNDTCSTCHQIDPQANVMSNYLTADDGTSSGSGETCQSGFLPIQKSNCTSCHNQASKIESCTQCHNYHVGSVIATHQ